MKQKLLIMLSALLFATTIYAQTEQQTSDKVKRTDVVVIDGYLKVYPENLGEFSEEPIALISQLNKECKYGYNTWRVPTQREINMIRSNGYASDQKYMTQSDYNGILLLVTTQETEIEKSEIKKNTTKIHAKKHEISFHAGEYTHLKEIDYNNNKSKTSWSIGLKYKYKPFKEYDIRFFGEIGSEVNYYEYLPSDYSWWIDDTVYILPIIVGVNYEYRINNNWSVFGDLGFGVNIPISKDYVDEYSYEGSQSISGIRRYYDVSEKCSLKYLMGYTLSPEIGFAYNNFMFSFKFNFYSNKAKFERSEETIFRDERFESYNEYDNFSEKYFSTRYSFSLRIGYRF